MYLSTSDIAKDLGLAKITVQKYCQSGFLPSELQYRNGNSIYGILSADYLKWKQKHFAGLKKGEIKKSNSSVRDLNKQELIDLSNEWLNWCKNGMLTGKPIKPRTVELYEYYF